MAERENSWIANGGQNQIPSYNKLSNDSRPSMGDLTPSRTSLLNNNNEDNIKLISDEKSIVLVSDQKSTVLVSDQKSTVDLKQNHINEALGITAIQEFYRGTNILVTGGTGFMGKVLIEKLLRSCYHLNRIYMLVRSKKGKNVDVRVQELFEDPLYDRLRSEHPNFREKIRIVSGDCGEPGLGLSARDRAGIMEHVHIVFHVAATMRFDEKLETAITTNIRGTRDLILLCRDCRNLKAVMHISTAYSHCHRQDIDEEFYDVPVTSGRAVKMVECFDDKLLTSITPMLLGKWPNTYTYTKAIGEEAVRTYGKSIPVGIFRPSIVICTRKEPLAGWIDNLYGPTGTVVGVGMGIIRTIEINGNAKADLVPCDMAVSALIASAWDVHERKRCSKEDPGIPIYNYVSSWENPITWGEYINKNLKLSWKIPFNKTAWMVFLIPSRTRFLYKLYALFLHLLPATMIDAVLFSTGKSTSMLKTYEKIHKFSDILAYFCTRQWKFTNPNVQKLWQKLSPEDQSIFDFNTKNLQWDNYFDTSLMGIRTYLLKDDPKTLPNAIRRRLILYWLHTFVKCAFFCLLMWLFWAAMRNIPAKLWEMGPTYSVRKPFSGRIKSSRTFVKK